MTNPLDTVYRQIPNLRDGGIGQGELLTEANLPRIKVCRKWLRENIVPTHKIQLGWTSYGLKHIAEEGIGYITNGEFIAAAVLEGYVFKLIPDSPNVRFGMSKRSISEARSHA